MSIITISLVIRYLQMCRIQTKMSKCKSNVNTLNWHPARPILHVQIEVLGTFALTKKEIDIDLSFYFFPFPSALTFVVSHRVSISSLQIKVEFSKDMTTNPSIPRRKSKGAVIT
ncbi:unnamed protein product [Musa acuminata subsp. burmannicoides]